MRLMEGGVLCQEEGGRGDGLVTGVQTGALARARVRKGGRVKEGEGGQRRGGPKGVVAGRSVGVGGRRNIKEKDAWKVSPCSGQA